MKAPHRRGGLAYEPGSPPDHDHLWQRPAALLKLCVEGTQACDKGARISAVVGVVFADERPAARLVRLVLFQRPSPSRTSSMVTLTVTSRSPTWLRRVSVTSCWILRATCWAGSS